MRRRIILAKLISLLPLARWRAAGYRLLLGYRVEQAHLGWRAVIAVSAAELIGCRVGRNCRFLGPMCIHIGRGASIGRHNEFLCEPWTAEPDHEGAGYARRLEIGPDVLITEGHFFDLAGAITIGPGTWIAGRGSQFWTHGAGVTDRDIHIGPGCYVGSAVRFAPGAAVGRGVLVALGSVVTGKIEADDALVAGQPARVCRQDYHWRNKPAGTAATEPPAAR